MGVGSALLRIYGCMQVTGLALSPRHPYMFSCGLDKQVKCWDLEYNKVRPPSRLLQGPLTRLLGGRLAGSWASSGSMHASGQHMA